jgi:hypothetical protein
MAYLPGNSYLSFIALLVFMGFGFIISGLAKTESSIPPLANIITLPQFLLAGTFFPSMFSRLAAAHQQCAAAHVFQRCHAENFV